MKNSDSVLAFDFGTKIIGTAIGQYITKIACPLSAVKSNNGVPNWKLIKYLLEEWQPKQIIIGLPLNMNGTRQYITKLTYKFANEIHCRFNASVSLYDERLSTIEAKSRLFEYGGFRALHKDKINSISAVIILESYFNKYKN